MPRLSPASRRIASTARMGVLERFLGGPPASLKPDAQARLSVDGFLACASGFDREGMGGAAQAEFTAHFG
jgi:hypothetical protein